MNNNVSVLTDNAKAVVLATSDGYQGNVLAHVNGDFGVHNSILTHGTPFYQNGSVYVSTTSLRMTLTNWLSSTPVTVAVVIPVIAGTNAISAGGPPVILQQPLDLALAAGANAQFDIVVASQDTPVYVWDNGTIVVNGNTPSLILTNVTTSDTGTYFCTVSNSFGSVVSTGAVLNVGTAPVIIFQSPSNFKLHTSHTRTDYIYVDTTSASAVTFQWQLNNINLTPSATTYPTAWTGHPNGSILLYTGLGLHVDDTFRCIATNANGSTFSMTWRVVVAS